MLMSASMRIILLCLLVGGVWGCRGASSPSPEPSPTSTSGSLAPVQSDGWVTYFATDGGFSAQFPKEPQEVGRKADSVVLACGLDKVGSNLALMRTPLPPDFKLEQMQKTAAKQFGPQARINSSQVTKWQGRDCLDLDASVGIGQVWMRLIPDKPYLYQLVALKSAKAPEDVTTPVQARFFSAFQITGKSGGGSDVR